MYAPGIRVCTGVDGFAAAVYLARESLITRPADADGLAFDVFKDVMRSDAGITARGADGVVDEDLRNVFDSIDTDNDGIISADACAAVMANTHTRASIRREFPQTTRVV